MIQFKINKAIKDETGFAFTTKTGIYGTDYLMRALVTARCPRFNEFRNYFVSLTAAPGL